MFGEVDWPVHVENSPWPKSMNTIDLNSKLNCGWYYGPLRTIQRSVMLKIQSRWSHDEKIIKINKNPNNDWMIMSGSSTIIIIDDDGDDWVMIQSEMWEFQHVDDTPFDDGDGISIQNGYLR